MSALTRRRFLGQALAAGGILAPGPLGADSPRLDLVIGQGADVSRLDPHLSTNSADTAVSFNIHDTLVQRRADGRLHPSLATSWERSDPTTWRFHLRRGVVFHTGDPFEAADVRASLERTRDPAARTLVSTVFATVERVEARDPHTAVMRTHRPDPLLPARLASFGGQMLSRRYLERAGADGLAARPVGTGPVRFVEWVKDDRLVLERTPAYWDGEIEPRRVIVRAIPDVAARVAALLRGEIDLMVGLPADHVDRVARHPSTRVEEVLYAGQYVLVVDSRRPPLDNPRVKQALSLAIDRRALLEALWLGRGLVPNGPIPAGEAHHDPALPPLRWDPALARQRLREAGYRNEVVHLESSAGRLTGDRAMSEAIVSMWRDVGVNAQLEILEASVIAQKMRARSFKGLRWAAPASTLADPDGMLWRLLAPGGIFDTWRHPRFDELGASAQVTLDETVRGQAYREMTAIFLEHLPWIPVLQPVEFYGVQRGVEWRAHPTQQVELRRFNLRLRGAR